jgi:hypothetical protein
MEERLILRNEDIAEVLVGIPVGHHHLRAIVKTTRGKTIIMNEATLANIVRAYIGIKTHPLTNGVRLIGGRITGQKKGYAAYQLIEEKGGEVPPAELISNYLG